MKELTIDDFARSFGILRDDLSQEVRDLIDELDFGYQELGKREKAQVITQIMKNLEAHEFSRVGKERQPIWEQAWSDNLHNFIQNDYSLEALIPKFISASPILRLNREYVRPRDPNFELNFFKVFRLWCFTRYFTDLNPVYEFGCGSGFNLVALAKLYPEKELYGLDWAAPSIKLVNLISETHNLNMSGRLFDVFSPDEDLEIGNKSAILTVCALEQIGKGYEAFLQFLLRGSSGLCVNIEPLVELYDKNDKIDCLAIEYHKQRGYLESYLVRLKQLEAENRIKIYNIQRLLFGSLYHEGYSFVVWRPINHGFRD